MILILIAQNKDRRTVTVGDDKTEQKNNSRILLLQEGLRAVGLPGCAKTLTPDMIGRTKDGKPFFPDIPEVRFNLSHSGDRIACVFSDKETGLDLQVCDRTHDTVMRIAKRFFTAEEYEALSAIPADESDSSNHNSSCRSVLFYRLWSVKEAYLKYIGCGLSGKMDGFIPDPLPDPGFDTAGEKDVLFRGRIRVLGSDPRMTPAEYAVLRTPEGFAMVVCAKTLPEEITVRTIRKL